MTKKRRSPGGGEAHVCACDAHAWARVFPSGVTMVDVEDAPILASKWWRLASAGHAIGGAPPNRRFLHRLVNGTSADEITDHRDMNKMNNRRGNLRSCTHSLNHANGKARPGNRSGFKGVTQDKKRWNARITVAQKHMHIGNFGTAEEAAFAYNAAARKFFGEFARLNEVRMG